jgi:hypothetical protein
LQPDGDWVGVGASVLHLEAFQISDQGCSSGNANGNISKHRPIVVVHACNPSYMRGRNRGIAV